MAPPVAQPDGEAVSLSKLPAVVLIRGILMTLFVVAVVAGLHAYLAHRIVGGLGASGPLLWVGYVFFVALFLSVPAGFAAGRRRPSLLTRAALWSSHVWIGVFGLLLVSVLAAELVRGMTALVVWGAAPWTPVHAGCALGIALAAALWGFFVARGKATVRRRDIAIKGLGEGLRGVTVAQISDIHIGQTLDGRFLQRLVDQVNALDADIVAVTGDLVDGFVDTIGHQVAPLRGLRAAIALLTLVPAE